MFQIIWSFALQIILQTSCLFLSLKLRCMKNQIYNTKQHWNKLGSWHGGLLRYYAMRYTLGQFVGAVNCTILLTDPPTSHPVLCRPSLLKIRSANSRFFQVQEKMLIHYWVSHLIPLHRQATAWFLLIDLARLRIESYPCFTKCCVITAFYFLSSLPSMLRIESASLHLKGRTYGVEFLPRSFL